MITKKKFTLNVVFDTSVVYTGSANDLLRKEIVELIGNHTTLTDIQINWHVPEIVIKERTYQMNKKGLELLISIQKLERLLGHNLNITEEIIASRINETINKQVEDLSVRTVKIDTSKVNWESIIHSAIFRHAPFEDGEKEKGFRDALVLESLKQVISNYPSSKNSCRTVLITKDGLLHNSATKFSSELSNVNVFNSLEELSSLINVLNSEIKEELINSISLIAKNLFYDKEDKAGLYYSEEIFKRISDEYKKELNLKPEEADERINGRIFLHNPGFEKKVHQRIYWKSILEVEFENFKNTYHQPFGFSKDYPVISVLTSGVISGFSALTKTHLPADPSLGTVEIKKEKISEGRTKFEILWSVTLTTKQKLTKPKIESINFIETMFK
jgi:hypothetical protein